MPGPERMVSDRRSHMERPHWDAQSQAGGLRGLVQLTDHYGAMAAGAWRRLVSDQRDEFSLCFVIALDVPSRRSQICVTRELLDISEAATYLTDFPGCTSDEGSASRVRRAADHAEARIHAVKPDGHGAGR